MTENTHDDTAQEVEHSLNQKSEGEPAEGDSLAVASFRGDKARSRDLDRNDIFQSTVAPILAMNKFQSKVTTDEAKKARINVKIMLRKRPLVFTCQRFAR